MDIEEMAHRAKQMLQEHKDADTPENEARLTRLVEEHGARLERTRGKNPQRYRLVLSNGSIGPMTLADVEKWIAGLQAK